MQVGDPLRGCRPPSAWSPRALPAPNGATLPIQFLLPFLSSTFVPANTMPAGVRWFAEQQPFTPVVESMRALLTGAPVGDTAYLALAWCGAIAIAVPADLMRFHRVEIVVRPSSLAST
jgi:ABC-type multidrug transport system permease subunit